MSIALAPRQEKLVKTLVASGMYSSSNAVLDAAFTALKEKECKPGGKLTQEAYWAMVREKVASGLKQAEEGKLIPGHVVLKRLRQRSRELQKKRKS